jgi:hypothetical protein
VIHEFQKLLLQQWVETCSGFVKNQQVWTMGECLYEPRFLPVAFRELTDGPVEIQIELAGKAVGFCRCVRISKASEIADKTPRRHLLIQIEITWKVANAIANLGTVGPAVHAENVDAAAGRFE